MRIEQSNPGNREGSGSKTPEAGLGKSPNTYLERPLCPQMARQRVKSLKWLNLRGESLCYATVIPQGGAAASEGVPSCLNPKMRWLCLKFSVATT